jgi:hypothetical protein
MTTFPELQSRIDGVEGGNFQKGAFMFRRSCFGFVAFVFLGAAPLVDRLFGL